MANRIEKPKNRNDQSKIMTFSPSVCSNKPEISDEIIAKWQKIIDLIAKMVNVPSGVITKLIESDSELEAFVTNVSKENPFTKGDRWKLNTGMYCEYTMKHREVSLIPDALADPEWENNPDIEVNLVAYLGVPIAWPDGEMFGTLCVLDNKENHFSAIYKELLHQFRLTIEADMMQLVQMQELENIKDTLEEKVKIRTESLRKSEEKYHDLYDNAPDMFASVCGKTKTILECNDTLANTLGYRKEEIIGGLIFDIYTPNSAEYAKEKVFPVFLKTGIIIGEELKLQRKDGSSLDVSLNVSAFRDESGNLLSSRSVWRDITDRKKMEIKLQQAQKMESIGTLAGGIAHDFNNLLYPIIGFAEMLKEDLPPGSPEHENAQEIFNAGRRGGELVKQILAFSRQADHKLQPVRIQKILKEVLKLTRSSIPIDIEMHQDIQQDCGSVMAEATQLHQISMNLITNAYHAVENASGIISVQLKEIRMDAGELKDRPLKPGKYAMLSVSDNGSGIPRNMINNIFEPYFTTKENGKGTGLGLAVVYGIVKEHKGDIKVYSEEGKGSTFDVYLPLIKKSTETIANDPVSALPTGTESLLLVDDEKSVVRLEKLILERLGYNVSAWSDSLEALEIFKSNPVDYDLVITDMTMPGMTGDKLTKEILSIKSDMPVIICTGFSERINKEQAEAIGVNGFLMKPVIKSEMAQMVRKVLDEAKVYKEN